jgi:hypothetical protein
MSGPLRTALERSLSVVVPWLAVGVMRLGAGTTLARAQMGFIPARSRRDTINALGGRSCSAFGHEANRAARAISGGDDAGGW